MLAVQYCSHTHIHTHTHARTHTHVHMQMTPRYRKLPSPRFQAGFYRNQICVADVKDWINKNKLKLNEEKTELLVVRGPHPPLSSEERTVNI